MADQSRQIKLAAAKKKLKEFQQKSSPASVGGEKCGGGGGGAGAKKKRKVKGLSQHDAPSTDRNSPDNFDRILKTLSQSNGVVLPPYSNSQVSLCLSVCLSVCLSLFLFFVSALPGFISHVVFKYFILLPHSYVTLCAHILFCHTD
ncbi:golgin subfamily A member 2-like [Sander lucioperca]|uniref:golgin subfamily A member 2-like n=1 Tax=Sander lucioperca TaxID=283035 RepID=UPI001653A572|nr:golgin subfamily A member 2-like [Sander lucioperca]